MPKYKALKDFFSYSLKRSVEKGEEIELESTLDEIVRDYDDTFVEEVKKPRVKKQKVEEGEE